MAPAQTTSTIYRQTIGKKVSEIKKKLLEFGMTIFWKDKLLEGLIAED